ncbi:MAG: hypothetical protein RJA70_1895 [Pseudomonadota bacterium]
MPSCRPSSSSSTPPPAETIAQRGPGEIASAGPRVLFLGDDIPAQHPTDATAQTPPGPSSAQGEQKDAPKRRYTVAFVGDSLTDAKSHGGGFIRSLETRCPDSRFDNFGKGADMVNQMARRFQREVRGSGAKYTHVAIFGGVNDLYSDLTAKRTNDKIQTDLLQMYRGTQELGAQVVAFSVAPWGGFERYFNARRGENTLALNSWIQSQRGVSVEHVIDAHTLLRCGHPHELCPEYAAPFKDGIHFGAKGHEILGEALFSQVFSDCR